MKKLIQIAIAIFALFYLGLYVVVALQRMFYPYEIEWMEGGMVLETLRVLTGQSLYVAPSVDYEPFCYAPLYFYISAVFTYILGPGFLPLRLVSFLASLACFYYIAQIVRTQTASRLYGLVGAGLFAAMFAVCGTWFDIGRVDSLYLAFYLAALRYFQSTTPRHHIVAGVLLSLAFLTKQSALLLAIPLIGYSFLTQRGWARFYSAITFGIIAAGATALLILRSNGWYYVYAFLIHSQHPALTSMLGRFWTDDIIAPMGYLLGLTALLPLLLLVQRQWRAAFFFAVFAFSAIAVSWFGRIHTGGYLNAIFPAAAALAISAPIFLAQITIILELQPPFTRRFLTLVLQILLVIQFAKLYYEPRHCIPTKEAKQATADFIATIHNMPGQVLMPYHPYYLVLAGKNPCWQVFASGLCISELRDLKKRCSPASITPSPARPITPLSWIPHPSTTASRMPLPPSKIIAMPAMSPKTFCQSPDSAFGPTPFIS